MNTCNFSIFFMYIFIDKEMNLVESMKKKTTTNASGLESKVLNVKYIPTHSATTVVCWRFLDSGLSWTLLCNLFSKIASLSSDTSF